MATTNTVNANVTVKFVVRLPKPSRERRVVAMRMVDEERLNRFLYFGYGSNMLNARLLARTPSART
jgi:hypothetical protein